MTSTLRISKSISDLGLADAVKSIFGESETTALLYGSGTICIGVSCGAEFVSDRTTVDLSDIYQADVFVGPMTLNWRRTAGQSGTAVLLSHGETPAQEAVSGWNAADSVDHAFCIDQQHLIWGKPDVRDGRWTRLSAARIGGLHVPLSVPSEHKAIVRSKAWFRPLPEACGNPQFVGHSWGPFDVIAMQAKGSA
ncbi:MAG: CRISPR-associated protein Csx19 [Rhizobium sp.]